MIENKEVEKEVQKEKFCVDYSLGIQKKAIDSGVSRYFVNSILIILHFVLYYIALRFSMLILNLTKRTIQYIYISIYIYV